MIRLVYPCLVFAVLSCAEQKKEIQSAQSVDMGPREIDVSVPDQSLDSAVDRGVSDSEVLDLGRLDMATECTPNDCGPRPPDVTNECGLNLSPNRLLGCVRVPGGSCEWLTEPCPPPCVGIGCPEPCEPLLYFDAGDGCNTCQCPASGIRLNSVCSQFRCGEIGCRSDADCTERGFCDFPEGKCGVDGVRGVCSAYPQHCSELFRPGCGCDGSYGSVCTDLMPYGGCPLPYTNNDIPCIDTVCRPDETFCLVNEEQREGAMVEVGSCESLPPGCEPTDCACFIEKLPTHLCFNNGSFIIMIPKAPE